MIRTQDPELALEIAEAMVAEFEDYLFDDDLYRQLMVKTSAGNRTLKMSAGSLLDTLHELAHATETGHLTPEQADRFTVLSDAVEQLSHRYASMYRQKLARELKSQIDSWRWFLQDCLDNRLRCQDEYPFDVRIRSRIALLMDALGDDAPADQVSRLQKLDRELQEVLVPGEFILDGSLRERYPKDRYWWLYGRPGGSA
jgi:hypothetical protein